MMNTLYRAVLALYPSEFKAAFAAEMIATMEQRMTGYKSQSTWARARFALAETAGLLNGATSEWLAKWAERESYLTSRSHSQAGEDLPESIDELQTHLQQLIRSMEFAIARHDFRNARRYSNQERTARAQLNRLRSGPSAQPSLELSRDVA